MKIHCDFPLWCTTARAPPLRGQRRHPFNWGVGARFHHHFSTILISHRCDAVDE
jgi:hypothetical protein